MSLLSWAPVVLAGAALPLDFDGFAYCCRQIHLESIFFQHAGRAEHGRNRADRFFHHAHPAGRNARARIKVVV